MSTNTCTELVEPFTVVKVEDTRTYEEVDDGKFAAIPGSGVQNECERCGRLHEIHAHVVDANGRTAVVGVGCMNADKPEVRKLQNAAKRDARNAAKAVATESAKTELAALKAQIPVFPADRIVRDVAVHYGQVESPRWQVDGVEVWSWDVKDRDKDDEERVRCLESAWMRRQLTELAGGYDALSKLQRRAGVFG